MKAVIPAAGKGTRMYPITRDGLVSKEMLPIQGLELIDPDGKLNFDALLRAEGLPAIEYAIMRAVASGVTKVVVVSSERKEDLNTFLDSLRRDPVVAEMVKIKIVMQEEANGLGDAFCVGATGRSAGAESNTPSTKLKPFLGILPDDLFVTDGLHVLSCPVIEAMIKGIKKGRNSVGTMEVADELIPSYGIVAFKTKGNGHRGKVSDFVEKPEIEVAPSNVAIAGMYGFQPTIISALDATKPDDKGEIQITNAMISHLEGGERYKAVSLGERVTRHDIGRPEGYEAFLHYVIGTGVTLPGLHEMCREMHASRAAVAITAR